MVNSNFSFFEKEFPALEKMGCLAEGYIYSDPNTCLYKMGSLAETIVNYMLELEELKPPSGNDNTHANRIKVLQRAGKLSPEISDIFYVLRIKRNEAVHEGYDSFEECMALLEMAYTLSVWFMQIYGECASEPAEFVLPEDIRNQADYQKLLEENEKLSAELEKAQATALSKLTHKRMHASERRRRADRATRNIRMSERETRYIKAWQDWVGSQGVLDLLEKDVAESGEEIVAQLEKAGELIRSVVKKLRNLGGK